MTVLDDVNTAREGVDQETVDAVRTVGERYKYGFSSDIETEYAPKGLNEDIVRLISEKNSEPEWLLDWRLQAFARWQTLKEPTWAMVNYPKIDFQDQYYYARPRSMAVKPKSLDQVDPNLLATLLLAGDEHIRPTTDLVSPLLLLLRDASSLLVSQNELPLLPRQRPISEYGCVLPEGLVVIGGINHDLCPY